MNDLNEEKFEIYRSNEPRSKKTEKFENGFRDGKRKTKKRTEELKAEASFAEQSDQNPILPQDIQSETSASIPETPETTQESQELKDETEDITIKQMGFNELTKTACGNGEMVILGKNNSTLRVSYNREQSRYFLNGEKTEKNTLEIRLDELAEKDGEVFQVLYEDARMIPENIDFELGKIREEIAEIEIDQEPEDLQEDSRHQTLDASVTPIDTTAAECAQLEEKVAQGAPRPKRLADFDREKIDLVRSREQEIRGLLGKELDEFIQENKQEGKILDPEKTKQNWAQIVAQNLGLENGEELEDILSSLDYSRWYKFSEIGWEDIRLMALTTVRAFLRYSGIKDDNVFEWAEELKELAANEKLSKEKLSEMLREKGIEILTK